MTPKTFFALIIFLLLYLTLLFSPIVFADCVSGASNATRATIIDSQTIILSGMSYRIQIRIAGCPVGTDAKITVLKNRFCDYEAAVLSIDGIPCGVNDVTILD